MAHSGSYKNPPSLGPNTVYETWKKEVEVWQLMTDVDKKKQALAVTLTLTGQARAKALELDVAEMNSDDGMNKLISALDSLFKKETVDLAYEAYSNFDSYRKMADVHMSDYVIEFERRYTQCKKYEMTLPDAVLSFKLLDSADLSQTERQLVLTAASDMKFSSMKSALKRIFGDSHFTQDGDYGSATASASTGIKIKQESAFFTQKSQQNRSYRRIDSQSSASQRYKKPSRSLKGTNPLDKFGRRTKCMICQSVFHWAKDCQHRSDPAATKITEDDSTSSEVCNLVLFAKDDRTDNEIFMTESFGCAVIDTACTRTVCGRKWLDNYICNLDDMQKSKVKTAPSNRGFKFGDGVQVNSTQTVRLPAKIGSTKCEIDTEVVDVDIPLLLSKASLKRAGTLLDLENDKAEMFKNPVKLEFTSSGHYCVDIRNIDGVQKHEQASEVLINKNISKADHKVLTKLHQQFGHASADRLKKLLESAGTTDTEVFKTLTNVVANCEVCHKYKKPAPKPAVGFPLATDFNETVAVDLHELERNVWYLHIIDEFTRFSAGTVIRSKQSSVFTDKFIEKWISIHGAPKRLYSDNGGEFNSAEVRDMCENFNIEPKTTAAFSPWSNGLLERHNQVLTDIMRKVKAERKCDWSTSLNWALIAKNSLCSINGYSAYQLVYGRNPNLPSVLVDKPPALEGTTTSQVVAKNVTSMYAARKAFTESECSERIRRALRKQTRPTPDLCEMGDKVYYKRPDCPEWKGPATVIGQDGAVVLVRHGGVVIRVHRCRLSKTQQTEHDNSVKTEHSTSKIENDDQLDNDEEKATVEETESDTEEDDEDSTDTENASVAVHPIRNVAVIKPGSMVSYRHEENDSRVSAQVLSRAGKVSGKFKNWYNLEYMEPDEINGVRQSVDLSQVADLEIHQPPDMSIQDENVMMLDDLSMMDAKLAELDSWKQNKVYIEVPDTGQKCISTRWVNTLKTTPDGIKPKARLVVRGFEEIDHEQILKDSPTCGKESLRLILALMAQQNWKPYSMDIKTAFLQGKKLERDIVIRPPKEANCPGKVWHLQKCVYGLGDASLYWYKRVKSVMMETGANVSKVDPAVFYWISKDGVVIGYLASHVDDFVWGGTPEFEATVINHIRATLHVGKEGSHAFQYVGMGLSSGDDEIRLDQDNYIDNLTPIDIKRCRTLEKDMPLTDIERDLLRSKVGQILWIAHQSRPDILFDACNLAARIKNGSVEDLLHANKVIRRIKTDRISLKFHHLGDGSLSLVVYSDASLGNLPDGGSQGGHIILLAGETGKFSPISWNSKKIRRVVRSTLAAETLAMADGIDAALVIAILFAELTTGKPTSEVLPLVCLTDCKSLCEAVKSTKVVGEKRLRIEISGIKELVENHQIQRITWSKGKKQVADCLTKKGASPLLLMKALAEGIVDLH